MGNLNYLNYLKWPCGFPFMQSNDLASLVSLHYCGGCPSLKIAFCCLRQLYFTQQLPFLIPPAPNNPFFLLSYLQTRTATQTMIWTENFQLLFLFFYGKSLHVSLCVGQAHHTSREMCREVRWQVYLTCPQVLLCAWSPHATTKLSAFIPQKISGLGDGRHDHPSRISRSCLALSHQWSRI